MSTPDTTKGQIVFIERREPPLIDGTYTVQVIQDVSRTDDGTHLGTYTSPLRTFAVRGERFTLDPNELLAVFPPRGGNGEYSNVLPHAVFHRATLPWERQPTLIRGDASWLALLLFEDYEAPAVQATTAAALTSGPITLPDGTVSYGTLPDGTVSYATAYELLPPRTDTSAPPPPPAPPVFAPGYGESWQSPCRVIDVPIALFDALAPTYTDLGWLAHVRRVSSDNKAGDSSGDQENSVVVGTRLPAPNTPCTVHLVSLEGLAPFLRPAAGQDPTGQATLAAATNIRLVSLTNWSFVSSDPAETFSGYLENVSRAPLQRLDTVGDPTAQLALDAGYTALEHQTRLGDHTISWYRGPLTPMHEIDPTLVPEPAVDGPGAGTGVIGAADQALRFSLATGMFNVSYAAAWELGRLLALRSAAFAGTLLAWRRQMIADATTQLAQQQPGALSLDNAKTAVTDAATQLAQQQPGALSLDNAMAAVTPAEIPS
jgi:hypothetical protein